MPITRLGEQAGRVKPFDRLADRLGRDRKIKHPIWGQSASLFDFFQTGLQALEAIGPVETGEIIETLSKLSPGVLIDLEPRIFDRGVMRALAKLIDRHRTAGKAQHSEVPRRNIMAARLQIIQRGDQLALG